MQCLLRAGLRSSPGPHVEQLVAQGMPGTASDLFLAPPDATASSFCFKNVRFAYRLPYYPPLQAATKSIDCL